VVPVAPAPLNRRELKRYTARVGERWPLSRAVLGGARVEAAAGTSRPAGDAFVVVLVSPLFDGVPWLERSRQAAMLWDADEMGDRADVHCYTPVELERRRATVPAVRDAVDGGLDLLA
jgi:hypothetical protein